MKLPRVLRQRSQAPDLILTLDIHADLPQFSGHFPGTPMLAGVAQVDWAIHFAEQFRPDGARFAGLEALKFNRVIAPSQTIDLHLKRQGSNKVAFAYRSDHAELSKGRICYELI